MVLLFAVFKGTMVILAVGPQDYNIVNITMTIAITIPINTNDY